MFVITLSLRYEDFGTPKSITLAVSLVIVQITGEQRMVRF